MVGTHIDGVGDSERKKIKSSFQVTYHKYVCGINSSDDEIKEFYSTDYPRPINTKLYYDFSVIITMVQFTIKVVMVIMVFSMDVKLVQKNYKKYLTPFYLTETDQGKIFSPP